MAGGQGAQRRPETPRTLPWWPGLLREFPQASGPSILRPVRKCSEGSASGSSASQGGLRGGTPRARQAVSVQGCSPAGGRHLRLAPVSTGFSFRRRQPSAQKCFGNKICSRANAPLYPPPADAALTKESSECCATAWSLACPLQGSVLGSQGWDTDVVEDKGGKAGTEGDACFPGRPLSLPAFWNSGEGERGDTTSQLLQNAGRGRQGTKPGQT